MSSPDPRVPEIPGLTDLTEIGRGGFGTVYRASQSAMSRDVAVKILNQPAQDEAAARRWRRELSAMGRVSDHPNIVTVHAADVAPSGHPYLVMSHIPGGTLAQRIARGPLPSEEVVAIGIALASALEAAHERGVLHLDVKPANVLMSPHGALLTDFGIARMADHAITATSSVSATVAYAAPEVLAGAEPSAASDVYGLTATLFAAAAGRGPFDGEPGLHPAAHMHRVMTETAPDLAALGADPALAQVVRDGLEKDTSRRIPDATALRLRLEAVRDGRAGPVNPTPTPPPIGAGAPHPAQMTPPPTPARPVVPMAAYVPAAAAPPTPAPAAAWGPPTAVGAPVAAAPPPPERSGSKGLVIGVIVAALVALVVGAGLALALTGGDDETVADSTAPSTEDEPDPTPTPTAPAATSSSPAPTVEVPESTVAETRPPRTTTAPPTTAPPAVLAGFTEGDVIATIDTYYQLIDSGQYDAAFGFLDAEQQAAHNGRDRYVSFWIENVTGAAVQGPTTVDLATGRVDTTLVFDLVGGGQSVEDVTIFYRPIGGELRQSGYTVNDTERR